VAVDGAYVLFPDARANSGVEQSEAISLAADAAGIALTLHRPSTTKLSEAEKRTLCFKLVEAVATPFEDWVTVIDADEVVVEGVDMRRSLAALDGSVNVAAGKLRERIDPASTEGKNNTSRTPDIYRSMELDPEFRQLQSRFFRVMRNMRCHVTHFNYVGDDADGVSQNLRPDIGAQNMKHLPPATVHQWSDVPSPVFEHRDAWRTGWRRRQKKEYYTTRDQLGIERVE
jgi:hypothetical protein